MVSAARTRYLIDAVTEFVQPESPEKMRIQLNGRDHELSGPLTLATLVEQLGLDTRKVAVERNLEIVPRSAYVATMLGEGDKLEIVNFVGGG